jgi:probable O-glycosylation ligase (exosortase A-associated)
MGIRFILLQVAVAGISLGALINPLMGLYGYIWYSLARPDAMSWAEGALPHSLIMAICTLAGVWRFLPNLRLWIINPWVLSMLMLQVVMLASCLTAQYPDLTWGPYWNFVKYAIIALLIPLYVVTLKELRWLMLVIAFSVGLVGFRFGVFGLRAGGIHFEGGLGGFMSDNNTLAVALLMGLPFIWYSRELVTKRWMKMVAYLFLFTDIATIVMSHSRGAMLSLAVLSLVLVLRSRHKLTVLLLMAVLAAPTVYLVQDSLGDRLATFENLEEDGSASSRIRYWKAATAMAKDYPLLGVGFGTYNWVALSPNYLGITNEKQHVIHNNYLQMAVDSGIFAFLILLWQIYFSIFWLGRTAAMIKKTHPELLPYPKAMEASLIAYSVGSLFVSRTDYDFYYFLVMMVGCWYTVIQQLPAPATTSSEPKPTAQTREWGPVQVGPAVPSVEVETPRRSRTPDSPIRSRRT